MLGISAVVMVVGALVGLFPQYYYLAQTVDLTQAAASDAVSAADLAPLATGMGGVLVSTFVKALATTVLSALLVTAVSEAVLGRRMPPGMLWQRVRHRIWGVVGLSLLASLLPVLAVVVLVALAVGLGLGLFAAGAPTAAAVGVGLLVGVPAVTVTAAYLWVKLALAAPALLLENVGPTGALRRSWELVRGSWWRLFGILLLTGLLVGAVGGVLGVPFSAGAGLWTGLGGGSTGSLMGSAVLSAMAEIVTGTVLTPFSASVTCLLYIDRRMRAEGLDVELMRAAGVDDVRG
jgi:hypothetical protein